MLSFAFTINRHLCGLGCLFVFFTFCSVFSVENIENKLSEWLLFICLTMGKKIYEILFYH